MLCVLREFGELRFKTSTMTVLARASVGNDSLKPREVVRPGINELRIVALREWRRKAIRSVDA